MSDVDRGTGRTSSSGSRRTKKSTGSKRGKSSRAESDVRSGRRAGSSTGRSERGESRHAAKKRRASSRASRGSRSSRGSTTSGGSGSSRGILRKVTRDPVMKTPGPIVVTSALTKPSAAAEDMVIAAPGLGSTLDSAAKVEVLDRCDVPSSLLARTGDQLLGAQRLPCSMMATGNDLVIVAQGSSAHVYSQVARARVRSFTHHIDRITGVGLVGGNTLLLTASVDATVRLWSIKSGRIIKTMRGHRGAVTQLWTDGSHAAVSAGDDGRILRWELPSGRLVSRFSGHSGPINGLVVDRRNRVVYSASADSSIRSWDWSSGKQLRVYSGHVGPVTHLDLLDGVLYSVGTGSDAGMRVWDAASGVQIARTKATADVSAMFLVGDIVLLGLVDGTILVWMISVLRKSSKEIAGAVWRLHGHGARITCILMVNNRIVSASQDGTVFVWGLRPGPSLSVTAVGPVVQAGIRCCVAARNLAEPSILVASVLGEVSVWGIGAAGGNIKSVSDATYSALSVVVDVDLAYYVDASKPAAISVLDVSDGTRRPELLEGHLGAINCLEISNHLVYSGSEDNSIKVWAVGRNILTHNGGHARGITCLHVAEEAQVFFSGGPAFEPGKYVVNVWGIKNGGQQGQIARFTGDHGADVVAIAYSAPFVFVAVPDSYVVALEYDDALKTLKMTEWSMDHHNCSALVAHKGILYSASGTRIKAWDVSIGGGMRRIATYSKGHRLPITVLRVSNGLLWSGGQDKRVNAYRLTSRPKWGRGTWRESSRSSVNVRASTASHYSSLPMILTSTSPITHLPPHTGPIVALASHRGRVYAASTDLISYDAVALRRYGVAVVHDVLAETSVESIQRAERVPYMRYVLALLVTLVETVQWFMLAGAGMASPSSPVTTGLVTWGVIGLPPLSAILTGAALVLLLVLTVLVFAPLLESRQVMAARVMQSQRVSAVLSAQAAFLVLAAALPILSCFTVGFISPETTIAAQVLGAVFLALFLVLGARILRAGMTLENLDKNTILSWTRDAKAGSGGLQILHPLSYNKPARFYLWLALAAKLVAAVSFAPQISPSAVLLLRLASVAVFFLAALAFPPYVSQTASSIRLGVNTALLSGAVVQMFDLGATVFAIAVAPVFLLGYLTSVLISRRPGTSKH